MSVNLRRFVNINVSRTKRNIVNPVRDTIALYGAEADLTNAVVSNSVYTSGELKYDVTGAITGYELKGYNFKTGKEITPVFIAKASFETDKLYPFARTFFDNGGAKIHIYKGTASVVGNKLVITDSEEVETVVPDEEIAVAKVNGTYAEIQTIAHAYNVAKNPDTASADQNSITSAAKIFAVSVEASTQPAPLEENIAVKFGAKGIEMSILAYLTRINVYAENTVRDYAFTVEQIYDTVKNVSSDDATVGACMNNFINIDCYLAKAIRNVGGDLITGLDIVNYYATIIMQQTVEEKVLNILSDKLSGADGTATIYNTVVAELNKYVRCGLLSAGNWENVDWVESYNDEEYVVVNANERLTLGYKVMVIPFAAMTQEDIASHDCPPIYIAMTNAYGIRKVVINGEVR